MGPRSISPMERYNYGNMNNENGWTIFSHLGAAPAVAIDFESIKFYLIWDIMICHVC